MVFPPPIDRTPRLACPHCDLLTPKADPVCVHCGRAIPEAYRRQQKEAGEVRRLKAKQAALVLIPITLALLTWLFWLLGY